MNECASLVIVYKELKCWKKKLSARMPIIVDRMCELFYDELMVHSFLNHITAWSRSFRSDK
jgi:hypothetical protein